MSGISGPRWTRFALAVGASLAVALVLNRVGYAYLAQMDYDPSSPDTAAFRDGCAMFLTQALPAFLGGVTAGFIARDDGYNAAASAFLLWCIVGFWRPFWQIPTVASGSAHSGLMHYFLYNPLPSLAFGALGGWLGGQFASGKFTLNDAEPVVLPGSDD